MTNYPSKYGSYQTNDLRVAFTKGEKNERPNEKKQKLYALIVSNINVRENRSGNQEWTVQITLATMTKD